MKKLIYGLIFCFVSAGPASANDAWIKVDANGNAIGGAVVCSADVCGDKNSVYSQLTLQPGEQYVLQFKGDPVTGNVAGISATQPDVKLQVDLQTNQWTKTTVQPLQEPTPVIINGQKSVITGVEQKQTWNPLVAGQESPTAVSVNSQNPDYYDWWYGEWFDWDWENMDVWFQSFWAWLELQNWEALSE